MSRRKKENARKGKIRKSGERGESAIVSFIILRLIVDEFTCFLCFPESYNSHRSQHAVCEDKINLGALESLMKG